MVTVADCKPITEQDEDAANITVYPGAYAWQLTNLRWLSCKFPLKGQLSLFEVDVPADVQLYTPAHHQLTSYPAYLIGFLQKKA